MKHFEFVRQNCHMLILLIFILSFQIHCVAKQYPNVVIILIDDSGYADIGETQTPSISSIGKNGVSFSNAYVTAPQCSPSRVGLLTGRYQQHYGHESNTEFNVALARQDCRIIPEYLPSGYSSAMIGKWNLGDIPNAPKRHGFNESFLYRQCDEAFASKSPVTWNGTLAIRGREYSTSMMFQKAQEFIFKSVKNDDHGGNLHRDPFFLYLAPMSPHVPHVFPPEYNTIYESFNKSLPRSRRKVLTMMHEIDEGVGGILSALRNAGVVNNTLLFFLNDNGAPNMTNDADLIPTFPNYPFRGFKGDTLEGGLHVQFLMQWPDGIVGNQEVSVPVSSMDILASIVEVLDITTPNRQLSGRYGHTHVNQSLDGVSLLPLLRMTEPLAEIYSRSVTKQSGNANSRYSRFRSGSSLSGDPHRGANADRLLFWRFGMECKPVKRAIRFKEWKWVQYGSHRPQLYNLTEDVSESNNLANSHVDMVEYLSSQYEAWNSQFPPISTREKKTPQQCHLINNPPSRHNQRGSHLHHF